MRMGIVTERRKKERRRKLGRRLMIAALAAVLCAAAASQDLRYAAVAAAGRIRAAAVFSDTDVGAQSQLTLPEMKVYALQMGVFDSGERASDQAKVLEAAGVRCMIWQREKMRLIACASASREGLDSHSAKGYDAYVYQETLPSVTLRLSAGRKALEAAENLLMLPDSLFAALDEGREPLSAVISRARNEAAQAQKAHPENLLYTELAQSLSLWCSLIDGISDQGNEADARAYALTTMCALCRELRETLIASGG